MRRERHEVGGDAEEQDTPRNIELEDLPQAGEVIGDCFDQSPFRV
jgi:hypothetical protein